jgi:hypothetical protein
MHVVLLRNERELLLWYGSRTHSESNRPQILLVRVPVEPDWKLLKCNSGLLQLQIEDQKLHCKFTKHLSKIKEIRKS